MQITREKLNEETQQQSSISHVCNGVVHPNTGETITKYKTLINDPATRSTWMADMCTELGRLSQGWEKKQKEPTQ